ncbi:MAG: hypothetical protein PHW56_08820, partial [Methanosarcinaceae archaeon]|nr:hypothetical protein [Methanosarcinaceae archaeon]
KARIEATEGPYKILSSFTDIRGLFLLIYLNMSSGKQITLFPSLMILFQSTAPRKVPPVDQALFRGFTNILILDNNFNIIVIN